MLNTKEFEEQFINSVICGDCIDIMQQIPDNFIDMVFVDPPYGKDGIYLYEIIAKESARILKDGKFAVFYASDYWMKETFIPCCNYLNYFYLFHSINTKGKASIFPRKIFAGAKSILVFSKEKPQPIKWLSNVLDLHKKEKSHRKDNWEQPVEDAKFFIDAFSKEGDIILDPNMGSGTTGIAALKLGRRFIGIDISEEYCRTAKERIESETGLFIKQEK